MTKFGKHADKDIIDLASEAALAALADGGVTMRDIGVLAAGNLMHASGGVGQQLQKQIGQTGIPVFNVANACATGATALRTAIMAIKSGGVRHWPRRSGSRSSRVRGSWPGASRKEDRCELDAERRYGAIAAIDGRVGTETMRASFAQIGMEYGHRYGGTSFELFARISEKKPRPLHPQPPRRLLEALPLEEIIGRPHDRLPETPAMCSANCDGAAAAVVVSGPS